MASGRLQLMTIVGLLFAVAGVVSAQADSPKKTIELQACRQGKGACVTKDICSVPTFRLRGDGCPSDLECCPTATLSVTNFDVINSTEIPAPVITESESEEIVEWTTDDIPTEPQPKQPTKPKPTPKVEYNRTQVLKTTTTTKPTSATINQTKPQEAQRSEHNAPWLATIFNRNGMNCCHGALISNRIVLTAATCWNKCVSQPSEWTVRLGLQHSHWPNSSMVVKLQNGVKHDRFNSKNRDNNIGVLVLEETISLSQHINSISLPTEQISNGHVDGNWLYPAWIGNVAQASSVRQDILKPIELKQVNGTYCKATIKDNQKGTSLPNDKYFCILVNCSSGHSNSKCIDDDHKLLYAGNAGGPVVTELSDNRYVLYGLISRCYDSGKAHVPTLVTNVFDFKPWIDNACEAACQEAHKTVKNVYPMTSTEVNPTANTDSKEIKGTKTADNAEDDVDEMHKQELQGQLISVTTSFTNDEDLSAETVAHNAPWLATIFNGTGFHCCNGALLTNRSVVSIATCFSLCGSSVGEWRVKVGQWYSNANNTFKPDEFQVSCFKRHSNFKSITRINNIAILKLNRAVRFDSTIQPISLPTNAGSLNDVTFNLSYTGWSDSVALIGWKENVALKTIATETIKDNSCEAWVRKNQPSFKFDASFKCITSTDHKLICDNKAGGPVVAVMAGHSIPRYILYGLVSKNVGCDREQSFAILTNVSPFAEWIEKNLNMSGCSES
uniref:Peptidase S1 domain-containing protein n=1 Tax=Anopheles albimanus TaxID=7167 RepID=A0A182FVC7_ANOAL